MTLLEKNAKPAYIGAELALLRWKKNTSRRFGYVSWQAAFVSVVLESGL